MKKAGFLVRAALLVACACAGGAAAGEAPAAALVEAGRALYVEGRLPDGQPLQATRDGLPLAGRTAACIQCHRGSGLGQVEGEFAAPPVTGRALFGNTRGVIVSMDRVRGKAMNVSHEPYTDAQFAGLVRDGVAPTGRKLLDLMPRYRLDASALDALKAYLGTLSAGWSPGVTREEVRFATVITPEVSPERARIFLDTLRAAVARKNANTMPGRRHMVSAAEFAMVTERKWALEVWQLQGEPGSWAAQLEALYAKSPVFAVLSGISESTWEPVHGFCEARRVPCWFPSLAQSPATAASGAFGLYFHDGVRLEAALLAKHLKSQAAGRSVARVLQVMDDSPASRAAGGALSEALSGSGIAVSGQAVADGPALREALAAAAPGDAVVFWLPARTLGALAAINPPVATAYFSGLLAHGENAPLNASWQAVAHMVYPYELPSRRAANVAYFRRWIAQSGVALQDEPLQSEVYFATTYLADTLGEMLDNLHRDYLVERAEAMLSRRESRKAEDQVRDAQMLRRYAPRTTVAAQVAPTEAVHAADGAYGAHEGTTVYPALALGPGQRFASKGGYVLAFPVLTGRAVSPAPGWLTP